MSHESKVQEALTSAGRHAGNALLELGRLRYSDDVDELRAYRELHSAMGDLAAAQAWLVHARAEVDAAQRERVGQPA